VVDVAGLKEHEFRDPVHGFITVYAHEKEILDTREFQRLRRIRQLGLQSYVYHGAEHSRFGHSIGVMQLAGEATVKIFDKNKEDLTKHLGDGVSPADLKKKLYFAARLAGLLHDIGHAPFSHSGEALFEKKRSHGDYGVEIIRNSRIASIIDGYIDKTDVSTDDVINILDKHGIYSDGSFVKELISSPWDVDKMDYLLRDSIYCGVEYGTYDLRRLIDTLTLDKGYASGSLGLAIQEGGIHTIEQLILARYFMFTQVYFHDVRRAFDIILLEFIGDCLEEEYGTRTYPTSNDKYLKWDDDLILTKAKEKADGEKKNLAWRIIERKHYKKVYSTFPHPDPTKVKRVTQLKDKCEEEFKDVKFWLDRAVDHPEKFTRVDLPIERDNGEFESLVVESKVLAGLEEIEQCRIYADVREDIDRFKEIEGFCNSFM